MTTPHPESVGNRPYEGFGGEVGKIFATSTPEWPDYPHPGGRAPNIVVMLADDLGFADLGCYGSEIATPHIDQMASAGVQMTNFHVNPMCSPTRASMLTGLNSHLAGVGHVCHSDPGFPGYAMEMTDRAATLAELLRDNGWATMMVGKWHLTKDSHLSDGAPKHSWPLQKGFDRFYGILDGFTNFHHPHRLYEDNHSIDIEEYPEDYYFTDDLTDRAVAMIRESKAGDPSRPFFLYYAHGAVHAPLQATAEDIAAQAGNYDAGWDAIRDRRFARQLELGIMAEGTVLPPRNHEDGHGVDAWADLTDDQRRLYARYMEVFAAMVTDVDDSVGALLAELDRLGELDNTIFVFTSDNGGSREGEEMGTSSYFDALRLAAGVTGGYASQDFDLSRIDLVGGPQTLPHYPRGWAMVSNTPFRLYKINTHAGGHQVPFVMQWPAGDLGTGIRRDQYQHITDLMPTLLELAGIDRPEQHRGAPALPLAGTSMVPMIRDDEPSAHNEQYMEMIGHRGMYRDGWEAVTMHLPRTPFGDHEWELYHLAEDPTETTDLAETHPEKLAELIDAFDQAAWANQVYPLDEGTGLKMVQRPPSEEVYAQPVTILPGTPQLERYRSQRLIDSRNCRISVDLAGFVTGDRGYLFAHGDQGGGYGAYILDDHLWVVYSSFGRLAELDAGPVPGGTTEIVVDLLAPGNRMQDVEARIGGELRGSLTGLEIVFAMAPFQGIDVGINRRSPVSWPVFAAHGPFAYTGALNSVTFTPGDLAPDAGAQWIDFLRESGTRFE